MKRVFALILIGAIFATVPPSTAQGSSTGQTTQPQDNPVQAITSWIASNVTPTRVISAAIGIAGILFAIRRERKRSHLEIFLVKGSSNVHVKNVGSTDALELEVSVFDTGSKELVRSLKGQRLRKEEEMRIPLAGMDIPANRKLLAAVSYRNTNDREGKVRKKKRELLYLPGNVAEATEPAAVPALVIPPVLSRYRLAVLPLVNMSPDPADEYFADGMMEELIDKLSQVRELRVIARTSVMAYKKMEKKASEIGRELGVGTLIEGSVRKAGNKIRITVQLIDTATEEHLWSSAYDKDLGDVFAIQSEIAAKVSSELEVHLLDSERLLMERKPTENAEAYTLYLKGRFYWNERTKDGTDSAVAYFEEAIRRAPKFALAYSALADCYVVYPDFGWQRPRDAYPKAKDCATKAIEIDPVLAEPHASLGLVFSMYDFNWRGAEEQFKRALALKASYATAHHWYSIHLRIMGRLDESLEQIRQAAELDPLSRVIGQNVGEQMLALGRYKEGVEQLERVVNASPEYGSARCYLGWAYYLEGQTDKAIDEMGKAAAISGHDPFYEAAFACLLGLGGRRGDANAMIERLETRSKVEYVDKVTIAFALFGTGRTDEAFSYLERGYEERSHFFLYFRTMPWFKDYWGDPRWASFESRLGLRQD